MQNNSAAISRKLSDPDFQSILVNKCIGLTMGMFIIVVVLLIHDLMVWFNPPIPKYFFVDGKNPPHPVVALDSPIVNDAELLDWTVRTVLAPYNVNYHDFPVQLNTAARKFTQNGWNTFAKSYISSGNFEAMKQGMILCFAQAQRSAVITESLLINGGLAYRIQFPIVQTCQNSNQSNTQKMMLTALVLRTNSEDHNEGLVVDQLVAVAQ
jgi:intracellular multiplication protein IcmL